MAQSVASVRLADARAILGGARDSLRAVWDESATAKDRRLLLLLAGCSNGFEQTQYSGRAWGELNAELRGRIRSGLKKFRTWAALVEDGEVLP